MISLDDANTIYEIEQQILRHREEIVKLKQRLEVIAEKYRLKTPEEHKDECQCEAEFEEWYKGVPTS